MNGNLDAIVVGAGPAGSTVASLLARAGWNIALVERSRFPRRKVCGECIAASNLPLIQALGVGARFEQEAGPHLRKVALMRGSQTVLADLPAASDAGRPWGRALGRETLDALLLGAARSSGASILQPWSVTAIDGAPGNLCCTVVDQERKRTLRLCARLVIAAHGSWERLPAEREASGRIRRPGDLFAFKANFLGANLEPGLLPVLCLRGGYGGMVLGDGGVATLACCVRRDRLEQLRSAAPGQSAGEVVERALRSECLGVDQALQNARRDGAWLSSGPLAPGIRMQPGESILRVGNAAGEAHPIVGEGISMALQSAWLLSAHLMELRSRAVDWPGANFAARFARLQADYGRDWRRQFKARMRVAAGFAHVVMQPPGAGALLAGLALWPRALTHGARWSGKVRYLRLRQMNTPMPMATATPSTSNSTLRTSCETDSIAAPKE